MVVQDTGMDDGGAPACVPILRARRARPAWPGWADVADVGNGVWRADTVAQQAQGVVPSGHALLDAQLPGGGWPLGGLCDILQEPGSHGEWQLLLPALVTAQTAGTGPAKGAAADAVMGAKPPWVALIGAPYTPFGPGLAARGLDVTRLLWVQAQTPAERLWATEQALRCADVAAVLVWLEQVPVASLRRLQMAAQAHTKLLFALRPASVREAASPAVLRLALLPDPANVLRVELLKRRGPPLGHALTLPVRRSHHALDRVAA